MITTARRCIARAVDMSSCEHQAIFVCGPTAVGKTSISISLAEWLHTEIISFDSRQVYRELKIGSAPPTREELAQVSHHLIGSHSLSESLSAAEYARQALELMQHLFRNKDQLILVGGSGLYMKAIAEGLDDIPRVPSEIRENLNMQLKTRGLQSLQQELKQSDPEYFEEVDVHNPQRLIRALEVIRYSGKPYSSFRRGTPARRPFHPLKIGLDLPREVLYERINQRVDEMILDGLEEEVKSLEPYWKDAPLKTVGYDELIRYFQGETDRNSAIEEIKQNTRRYAKRQLTWFRRDKQIKWFHPSDLDEMKEYISSQSALKA
jgi:tRNA dimethylallyltransferase